MITVQEKQSDLTRFTGNLNTDQESALRQIYQAQGRRKEFLLEGGPGTGKSYTVAHYLQAELDRERDLEICLVAPTHKAKKVLEDFARANGLFGIDSATLAAVLKTRPSNDRDNRKITVDNDSARKPLNEYDIAIIDEASMVNSEQKDRINSVLPARKLIYVGDICQLPPINEIKSRVFTEVPDSNRFNLSTDVRFSGKISQHLKLYRDQILADIPPASLPELKSSQWDQCDDGSIKGIGLYKDSSKWYGNLFKAFHSDVFLDGKTNFCRAIAWTNKRVDELNKAIRASIWGYGIEQFIQDERLVCKSAVFRFDPNIGKSVIVMSTSDECRVIDLAISEEKTRLGADIKVWVLQVLTEGTNKELRLKVPHESSWDVFKAHIAEERKRIMAIADRDTNTWARHNHTLSDYCCYVLNDRSGDIAQILSPSYALTCHMSQGSTYTHSFVDTLDINAKLRPMGKNPPPIEQRRREQKQLIYVAASRATDRVLMLS